MGVAGADPQDGNISGADELQSSRNSRPKVRNPREFNGELQEAWKSPSYCNSCGPGID